MQLHVDIVTECTLFGPLEIIKCGLSEGIGTYADYDLQNQSSKPCLDLILMDSKPYGEL